MSRAGKFIPGGSNKAKRTGPIRAPESTSDGTAPLGSPGVGGGGGGDGKKKPLIGGLRKPVAKGQRLPITILSAFVCCVLVSAAWYFMAYLPGQRQIAAYKQQLAEAQAAQAAEVAKEAQEQHDREAAAQAAKGVVTVESIPSGAKVTVGDVTKITPANITDLVPGSYLLTIEKDGYEDYKAAITVTADTPVNLPTVTLVQKAGELDLTSWQPDVTYVLTGPNGYTHDGAIPDKLTALPIGDYSLAVAQKDWKLAPMPITIEDLKTTTKDIKFPYAKVTITSTPTGATVRDGRTIIGTTPVTLPQVRPTDLHFTVDLPPYTLQHADIHVTDFSTPTRQVHLVQDKDFIAGSGLPMVWIPEGVGFWAGKYLFRQGDFEKVAGYNPSFFRGANLPVESISWESAQAFVQKLNDYETKAGKVPAGFHYSLPTESQWEQFNADTDIATAAISSNTPLNSTQNVGYSAPNKYGLYDTIGNVWEWCLDKYDDQGNHSLRGGTWLSLPDNFPSAAARQGGPPKDAEKFIGFRVVLVPNS